ncbi:hypothetical protein GUJ93_ZPchr0007g4971 [Zizania palustris]|uniref:Uncharacterized protein n=1 Tax=Zizania palustris TaxID=103762 RepID=A0A8J5VZY9_ZIZPA|nr:hypothetical protein GUJ93_ZPchr0007g4971 [Zizania palustris]
MPRPPMRATWWKGKRVRKKLTTACVAPSTRPGRISTYRMGASVRGTRGWVPGNSHVESQPHKDHPLHLPRRGEDAITSPTQHRKQLV